MNTAQCSMARGALDWTSRQLASAASVPLVSVNKFQSGHWVTAKDVSSIRKAFETAGIAFVADAGSGFGILLKTPKPAATGKRLEAQV
ncbi:transcriptional regulator [Beijerinckia sp. L45]|uniref:transcriptional regulator n=1 Tax=Beijerinckia sp. L45 TaxID=1641855 RepID=UPI00131D5E3F|nr:transcriptional regulator [Beijerinckia sp. L45]